MHPDYREEYVNGDVQLIVDTMGNGGKRYWIGAGIASMEISATDMPHLAELLEDFLPNNRWRLDDKSLWIGVWASIFVVLVSLLVVA